MFIVFMLLLGAAFIVFACIADRNDWEGTSLCSSIMGGFAIVAVIAMLVVVIVNNSGPKGQIAKMEATYESLVYQAENDIYENDNDLGKKQLADQIQEWNEKIADGKVMQRNFMWGIFYPNIYDQFEPIPVELLK